MPASSRTPQEGVPKHGPIVKPAPARSKTKIGNFSPWRAAASPAMVTAMEFSPVTALAEANVYFDGKVVSHTILFADGSKKTLGIIFPGSYHFGTAAAERMEITEGKCRVELYGSEDVTEYTAGQAFDVPAQSGFSIAVSDAPCQYVCSFLD